jgi:hypothetical protein
MWQEAPRAREQKSFCPPPAALIIVVLKTTAALPKSVMDSAVSSPHTKSHEEYRT